MKKDIPVNFIALLDPVDRVFHTNTTNSIPTNVKASLSIIKTSRVFLTERILFKTKMYRNTHKTIEIRNHDGSRTTHRDIGGVEDPSKNSVFDILIKEARNAGVEI